MNRTGNNVYWDDYWKRKDITGKLNVSISLCCSPGTGALTGNLLGLINEAQSIPKNRISSLESSDIAREMGADLLC